MELIFSIYPYTHHIVINNNTQNQIYTCTKFPHITFIQFSPRYFFRLCNIRTTCIHGIYQFSPCIVRIVYSLLSIAVNPSDDIVLQRWDFILFPRKNNMLYGS